MCQAPSMVPGLRAVIYLLSFLSIVSTRHSGPIEARIPY